MPQGISELVRACRTPSLRKCSLESTLEAALPFARSAGLTRIADITGLDKIGIPVVTAIRPNAKSLSVSSGKGLTLGDAWVSGLMEAIELSCAESAEPSCRFSDLNGGVIIPDPFDLPQVRGRVRPASLTPDVEMAIGYDLFTGKQAAVPYELVHVACPPYWDKQGTGFLVSSNGLGAGNDRAEAILQGLCEVVERDALALCRAADPKGYLRHLEAIDLDTVPDPDCQHLVARCRAANVHISAFNITSDIGVPVYYCRLNNPTVTTLAAADGTACHPSSAIALRHAITEAIQTRLLLISGSRDDLQRKDYISKPEFSQLQDPMLCFSAHRDGIFDTVESATAWILRKLEESGFSLAICIELQGPSRALSFVRIIVPRLEGSIHSALYSPGARAKTCALSYS
ncbi:YcaO-like family protein [Mesorhizobium caraganae]|uniref:YcaO-like family protein n=1 Tax=Mesorhizobium caraganae TaxID=483206 RepID=UPI001FE4A50A|nr:YcaO-like family protein [Mesorhizobium caraganae]